MATEKTYNGWSNYETWNVNLWIDNEEGSYKYWRATAQECWDEAEADATFTREERAAFELETRLKDEITESMPDLGATMWSDLLSATLSEVDWREIADSMLSDVDKTEEDDDSDDDEEDE